MDKKETIKFIVKNRGCTMKTACEKCPIFKECYAYASEHTSTSYRECGVVVSDLMIKDIERIELWKKMTPQSTDLQSKK